MLCSIFSVPVLEGAKCEQVSVGLRVFIIILIEVAWGEIIHVFFNRHNHAHTVCEFSDYPHP